MIKPEVEILIIIDLDKIKDYNKVKSKVKPSDYCKTTLRYKNVKNKDFMCDYFDIDKLLKALKKYKSNTTKDHFAIFDILK